MSFFNSLANVANNVGNFLIGVGFTCRTLDQVPAEMHNLREQVRTLEESLIDIRANLATAELEPVRETPTVEEVVEPVPVTVVEEVTPAPEAEAPAALAIPVRRNPGRPRISDEQRQIRQLERALPEVGEPLAEPPARKERNLADGEGNYVRAQLDSWKLMDEEERAPKIRDLCCKRHLSLGQVLSCGAHLVGRLAERRTRALGNDFSRREERQTRRNGG